jgi:large subunit ribosomal protein L4
MLEVPIYNATGEKVGSESLDPAQLVKNGELNPSLLKQAIVMYHANLRQGTKAQKTRAEVIGSTRKLYRQKGTGRARTGNLRNPVKRGGGVAFAAKPRDFRKDMPTKMRRAARNQALLARAQSSDIMIVDGLKLDAPKTKTVAAFLSAVDVHRGCTLATAGRDEMLLKSIRNIPRAEMMNVTDLNAWAIMQRPKLIFTADAFAEFKSQLTAAKPSEISAEAASQHGADAAETEGN